MPDLAPLAATALDQPADERELLRRRAEVLAVRWLHGYTTPRTRNSYAVDIGLSPEARSQIPDSPANPQPSAEWAWIPWALDHGLNPAGALTRQDAEAYAHTIRPMPKNVRRRRWTAVCAFYRSLRADGIVACNPAEMVNRRTMGLSGLDSSATLPLAPKQVQALYLAAGLPARNRERNRALLAVLAATGCRAAEIVGIDLDDYRPQPEGHALIRLDGKGGKKRWVQLPALDVALVDEYLAVRAGPKAGKRVALPGQVSAAPSEAPLFTTSTGRRLHVNAVTRTLRTIAHRPSAGDQRPDVREAAKMLAPIADTLHPHQLRHTYAVTAEEAGIPVSQVQADLGHASLATTQTYLHARDRAKRSAAGTVSGIYHNRSET